VEPAPLTSETLLEALRTVNDPEVGMNVVDLGLVYGVDVADNRVHVRMTLTSAACPMGASMVEEAKDALARALPASTEVEVELVWDPPWTPSLMSLQAKQALGWDA
jgi:metal-sulfur cluster biosynthetic enzyme